MRIADSTISTQYLFNLNQLQASLAQVENEMSTGQAIQPTSADPLVVSEDMSDATQIQQSETYQSTMSVALSRMNIQNQALTSMQSNLNSIDQVVLQALNTSNQTPTALAGIQQTLVQLVTGLYQSVDTQQGDSYVFGGYATTQSVSSYVATAQLATNLQAASSGTPVIANGGNLAVFGTQGSATLSIPANATLQDMQTDINAATGQTGVQAVLASSSGGQQLVLEPTQPGQAYGMTANGVTLVGGGTLSVASSSPGTPPSGAGQPIQYAVSNQMQEQVNVNGTSLFNQVPPGGTQTLQQTLQNIIDDAGNPTALQQDLDNLNANMAQVTNVVTALGASINQVTGLQTQMQSFQSITQQQQASIENVNMAQVAVQYQSQLAAYQAALNTGSHIMLPTLAQYI